MPSHIRRQAGSTRAVAVLLALAACSSLRSHSGAAGSPSEQLSRPERVGLLLRGASSYQPPRYFYALLFPLSYFAVRLLRQAPKRYRNVAFLAVLLLHAYVQSPFYYSWLYRKDIGSQYSNRVSFAHEIDRLQILACVHVVGSALHQRVRSRPRVTAALDELERTVDVGVRRFALTYSAP